MAKNRIRLVIELGINENTCEEENISPEELLESIACIEDDTCDGCDILPQINGVNCTEKFFLSGGTITERELVD